MSCNGCGYVLEDYTELAFNLLLDIYSRAIVHEDGEEVIPIPDAQVPTQKGSNSSEAAQKRPEN